MNQSETHKLGNVVLKCFGDTVILLAQKNNIEKPDIDKCFEILKAEQHNILENILKDVDEANTAFFGARPMILKVLNVTIQYECLRVAKLALGVN